MKLWHIVPSIALIVAGAGCGGDDDDKRPAGEPVEVNTAEVKQSVQSAIGAALAARQGQGVNSAASFVGLGSGAFALLTPAAGEGAEASASLAARVAQDATEGAADCTDTGCRFAGYSPGGAYTLDGTMSWAEGHLVADLRVTMSQEGMSFDFETDVDLVVTDTSIDGKVTSKGSVIIPQAQQYGSSGQISWDASVEYRGLTFAEGQATGGAVVVSAWMSTGDRAYSGEATVTFP